MSFVQFSKLNLAFGEREILKNVTITMDKNTRAALSGANGSGKSTLMKVMAGLVQADSGTRATQKECRISYLPQSGIIHTGKLLKDEVDTAFSEGHQLFNTLETIGDTLKNPNLSDTEQKRLLDEHHELTIRLERMGWHYRENAAEQILFGLGFTQNDLHRPVDEFSGGWQMRIALAKILLQQSDILLLDEPTNYLDIEARTWLEEFLRNFDGGFLIVSHDRYFLDVCVTLVYELFNGDLHRYVGNYSKYEKIRRQELDSLIARYHQQQEEIHKLEDFVRRFRYKASKANQAQERLKQLEKIERIEIPESLKSIHFSFPPAPHSGKLVLRTSAISKTYSPLTKENTALTVISNLTLLVENKNRLAVTGKNGAGKSTLLRILAGVDPNFEGTIEYGAGVNYGYFSQESATIIAGDISIIEYIEQECPLDMIPKIRDMLGAFLFRGDDVYKSLNVLSGGEKSRIALLNLLLHPFNLLILDEPTNHLDLHSKDVLLQALADFNGTVIFVSHDRGFLEALATRVLELDNTKSMEYSGNYAYYLEQKAKQTAHAESLPIANTTQNAGAISYQEQKRYAAEKRKAEKEENRLLEAIDIAEEQKRTLETKLATPEIYTDGVKSATIQKKIGMIETELEQLHAEWEKALQYLESFY